MAVTNPKVITFFTCKAIRYCIHTCMYVVDMYSKCVLLKYL